MLFGLASMFPLLRPDCREFDAWLETQHASEPTAALIEQGETLLSAAERRRIANEHARDFPKLWRSFVDDLGDAATAERMVVTGSVMAALDERRTLDPKMLELIEERGDELRDDPAELLALVVEPTCLWSIAEAIEADEALAAIPDLVDDDVYAVLWNAAIEMVRRRRWSERHEHRLLRLVERVRVQLQHVGLATARDVLAEACAAFERDERVRIQLASMLLADSIDALPASDTLAALAV